MRIRVAGIDDAAVINEVFEHYICHSLATFSEYNKSIEQRAEEIELLLKDYPFLVAEDDDGRFLGFANAEPIRPQSGYKFCTELTIYLHPNAPKHQGIGTVLYERLLCILAKQGFRSAFGVLYGENVESLKLHEHFGFRQVAFIPNAGFKFGKWLDVRVMQKQLNEYDESPCVPIPFSADLLSSESDA